MKIERTAKICMEYGYTTLQEITDYCIEISREDTYIRNTLIWKYGSIGVFAHDVYEYIKESSVR